MTTETVSWHGRATAKTTVLMAPMKAIAMLRAYRPISTVATEAAFANGMSVMASTTVTTALMSKTATELPSAFTARRVSCIARSRPVYYVSLSLVVTLIYCIEMAEPAIE